MELKEFVKKVIVDLDAAISEANNETDREITFKGVREHRTALEFDIAVSVETTESGTTGGEIRVLGIGAVGGNTQMESKNSMVSRVCFGVDISEKTNQEKEAAQEEGKEKVERNRSLKNDGS